jgi:hypothetical protein
MVPWRVLPRSRKTSGMAGLVPPLVDGEASHGRMQGRKGVVFESGWGRRGGKCGAFALLFGGGRSLLGFTTGLLANV